MLGALACFILMVFVDIVKGIPDFWAIALGVALLAVIIIVLAGGIPHMNVPVIFCAFASTVFWWTATGLDGWAPNGGGVGKSVAALTHPATAGQGAFGGVISTPYTWVAVNTCVSLLCGCVLGLASARLTGLVESKVSVQAAEASISAT